MSVSTKYCICTNANQSDCNQTLNSTFFQYVSGLSCQKFHVIICKTHHRHTKMVCNEIHQKFFLLNFFRFAFQQ
ncbi:unnamed protein product [Acanthoscelides obtectus]|uniref:Uncharacterized protein n=1 Tax=Acanthoscelides obtectus TaxID=200917 RepID=A0A9P0MA10_ACAOB|nr:unnamed protein product [Acanthoscelides obtectus]CAK1678354.1 hypothetical protein AOBTE_LOCUS31836 [Acanthoscelides obtectus]